MFATFVQSDCGPPRHGVVFVHGVGDQRKSDTLLDMGEPLVHWLARWYRARECPTPLEFRQVVLSFAPTDLGDADSLPRATVYLPDGQVWVCAEAWWASSNRRTDFGTMLLWSWLHFAGTVSHLFWATLQRSVRLVDQLWHARPENTDPGWVFKVIDLGNCAGLAVLYLLGGLLGYPVLLVLLLLSKIPIPELQDMLLRPIRAFLSINASEFRVNLEDELQAANMRRRIAAAVEWLLDDRPGGGQCADVTIVAHSEGGVVSFAMLADPAHSHLACRVRKLITLGAGLNKSWDMETDPRTSYGPIRRLHGPIHPNVHWVDFWGSYDPVPAGWLQPPLQDTPRPIGLLQPLVMLLRRLVALLPPPPDGPSEWPGSAVPLQRNLAPPPRLHYYHVFSPSDRVVQEQRLFRRWNPEPPAMARTTDESSEAPYWPESLQVTNDMNVLTDHGGYWSNDEQVLPRIAAEIDAPYYRESPFWKGIVTDLGTAQRTQAMHDAIQFRRARVSVLALYRAVAVWCALTTIIGVWEAWVEPGGTLHEYFAALLAAFGPFQPIITVTGHVRGWTAELAPGLLSGLDFVLAVPVTVLSALVVGVPFILAYLLIRAVWVARWDRPARDRAVANMATAPSPAETKATRTCP